MSSKYLSFTLPQLKTELRKRNAKTSGRKHILVDRLEAYDRNFNFGTDPCDSSMNTEYSMKLPDALKYLDLNSDKKFASIGMEDILSFLKQMDKQLDQTPISLYTEKYLCYMRMYETEDGYFFLKSACRAEMRKATAYVVDVCVSSEGEVKETQCECAAGMGPSAHCKHVCAVLYGALVFNNCGTVNVENTCTEKLQSFHQVKKYTGSPTKSENLVMPGADESTNVRYDPRPVEYRNVASYQSHFRNACLNFSGLSKMPIAQLFEPANIRGVAHDHDYQPITPEDTFLKYHHVSDISDRNIVTVEERTRGQADNEQWREERGKRIQSSNFGRICKATDKTDFVKLADDLVSPKPFHSKATAHGIKTEKVAVKAYEEVYKRKVIPCGIFVSKTLPFLGCSPDGLVSDDTVLEVKCPYVARDQEITPATVPYLKGSGNEVELDRNHNYFYQVQGQLFCTGRTCCDFVVYTNVAMKCIVIKKDNDFISRMVKKLEDFYTKYFNEALLTKCFYREKYMSE